MGWRAIVRRVVPLAPRAGDVLVKRGERYTCQSITDAGKVRWATDTQTVVCMARDCRWDQAAGVFTITGRR